MFCYINTEHELIIFLSSNFTGTKQHKPVAIIGAVFSSLLTSRCPERVAVQWEALSKKDAPREQYYL